MQDKYYIFFWPYESQLYIKYILFSNYHIQIRYNKKEHNYLLTGSFCICLALFLLRIVNGSKNRSCRSYNTTFPYLGYYCCSWYYWYWSTGWFILLGVGPMKTHSVASSLNTASILQPLFERFRDAMNNEDNVRKPLFFTV